MDFDIGAAYTTAGSMRAPLREVASKIVRFAEHRSALWKESAAWLEAEQYVVHTEAYDNPPRFVVRVEFLAEPAPNIPLIFGDCLQQLRSALDYLAWQLVIANGGTPQSHRPATMFPILAQEPKARLCVHGGVDPDALAIIESLQPYRRPGRDGTPVTKDPLYVLDNLAAADRHRLLHVVMFAGQGGDRLVSSDGMEIPIRHPGLELRHGAEVVVPVPAELLRSEVKVHGIELLYVALKEPVYGGMQDEIGGLVSRICTYMTAEVLPRFEPFFLG